MPAGEGLRGAQSTVPGAWCGGPGMCTAPRSAGVPGLQRLGRCVCDSQGLGPAAGALRAVQHPQVE